MKRLIKNNKVYNVSETRYFNIIEAIADGESFTIPNQCLVGQSLNLDNLSPDDADDLLETIMMNDVMNNEERQALVRELD